MSGVVGIDPGLRNTGLVHVHRGEIKAAHTVTRRAVTDFGAAARQADSVAGEAWAWIDGQAPLEVVAEAFVDQRGRRHYSDRWKVPLVCGCLVAHAPGLEISWQDPAVLDGAHYGDLYRLWKAGRRGLYPGDRGLADDHQAAAACHALSREAELRSDPARPPRGESA